MSKLKKKLINNTFEKVLKPVIEELLLACFLSTYGYELESLKNDLINEQFESFKKNTLSKLKELRDGGKESK